MKAQDCVRNMAAEDGKLVCCLCLCGKWFVSRLQSRSPDYGTHIYIHGGAEEFRFGV